MTGNGTVQSAFKQLKAARMTSARSRSRLNDTFQLLLLKESLPNLTLKKSRKCYLRGPKCGDEIDRGGRTSGRMDRLYRIIGKGGTLRSTRF